MATLHSATEGTKKILKWGGIGILGLIGIYFFFKLLIILFFVIFPPKQKPPTVAFGQLTNIDFPKQKITSQFTYSLNTVTGVLPVFPDRMTVYGIVKPAPNFLALKNAKLAAGRVDFPPELTYAIDPVTYQWSDSKPPFRKLTANILTLNFTLTSPYLSNSTVLQGSQVPALDNATQIAQEFLTNFGTVPSDMDSRKTTAKYLKTNGANLVNAESQSDAQLVEVNFFQKDLEKLPVYYPNPPQSTIRFLIGSGNSTEQVVDGEYFHQDIATASATYPIKTAQEAFKDLQKGNDYVASYFGSSHQISIKNITLGYFFNKADQDYTIPIVVFEGSDGYMGYVSAVKNEWVKQ